MTGHIYSTKLDTPFVRKSIPLQPSEVPVRVLVVSPFSDDKSAHNQGKLASAKKEYIINPEQIKNTIAFWNAVGNKTMQKIHFNEEVLASLPVNDVSADMFTVTNETEEKENNEDSDTSSESGMETNNEDQDNCLGGPSLLRTNHESDEVVMTSATVTIGGTRHHDTNTHEKVMQVLSENENIETKEKTFVVRPPKEFVSDLDPDFLEIHYPDLLPFGRGGFGEPRRTNISRAALLSYMLNLSTRQFQQVDFLLPMYDMVTRQQVAMLGLVRSKIPSRILNSNNSTTPRAEAFGRVSIADLQMAWEYKNQCATTARKGHRLPPPPKSMNGVAVEFFTDIGICTQQNPHSQAAALRDRQCVYAAHNSNGKAQIWLTFSPDDAQSFKIAWYALGEDQSKPIAGKAPSGMFRFETLATRPVAAALHFENVLSDVIRYVIGWNIEKKRPYKRGGLFGVPKAWLRIVEEQGRLTLHAHCLIWIYGHSDIENQLKRAATLSGMSNTNWKIHHVETEERENANDSSLLNYAPLTTATQRAIMILILLFLIVLIQYFNV